MNVPFLYDVVLYGLYKLNGERTLYSVYHLLNGKKSSQTIQDVHLFKLSPFFKTYIGLSRNELENVAGGLEHLNFIVKKSDERHYQLTASGLKRVESITTEFPFFDYLNGWKYQYTDIFWERLSLLVQVVSNLNQNETKYIPIQKNKQVQEWVKNFLKVCGYTRDILAKKLYDEIIECLEGSKYINPAVLVIRLTGQNVVGLTEKQASETLQLEYSLYHFQFTSLLHYIIRTIEMNATKFPLLQLILVKLHEVFPLTASTKTTYKLVQQGLSVEKIAEIRKLKINTIQDHIVEMALNIDSFDISPYVDTKKQQLILNAAQQTSSRQLKHIRALVQVADYFEIRLVMASLEKKNDI